MGLIKDRHGTYCAQQKVPARLQAAVAQVLGSPVGSTFGAARRMGTMLNPARCRASQMLVVTFVASVYPFWGCDTRAQPADDLPSAEEPWLAEQGDWSADFNQAQI